MRLPLGDYIEIAIEWLKENFDWLFSAIKISLQNIVQFFERVYTVLPFYLMIIIFALIALRLAGYKVALFTVIGFLIIYFTELFYPAMQTLAIITAATIIAVAIGIPLGIWCAKSKRANSAITPILDFMQTMPSYVYLIPAVFFFGLREASGTIATIIFAMPPIVRLTNLGIRQVPTEVVEAATAFGSTPMQKLFKVQLPLAMPSILAGLNQTIMLSLSMVVVAAMISVDGLGRIVFGSIGQMDIGLGFEGGLAVVIVAMFLDKVTQNIANKKTGIPFWPNIKKIPSLFKRAKNTALSDKQNG